MADTDKKINFIRYANLANFQKDLGNGKISTDSDLVYIPTEKLLWVNGTYYSGVSSLVDIKSDGGDWTAKNDIDGFSSKTLTISGDPGAGLSTSIESNKLTITQDPITIDGLTVISGQCLGNESSVSHYGVCSTAASEQTKLVSIPGVESIYGAKVTVTFKNSNTASNPKLQVNSTESAYPIYYEGFAVNGKFLTAKTFDFVFDTTNGGIWRIVDVDGVVSDSSVEDNSTTKAYLLGHTNQNSKDTTVSNKSVYIKGGVLHSDYGFDSVGDVTMSNLTVSNDKDNFFIVNREDTGEDPLISFTSDDTLCGSLGFDSTNKVPIANYSDGSYEILTTRNTSVIATNPDKWGGSITVTVDDDAETLTLPTPEAGTGLKVEDSTTAGSGGKKISANLNSPTSLGTIGTNKVYAVGVDSKGELAVSVPWTNENSDYVTNSSLGTTLQNYQPLITYSSASNGATLLPNVFYNFGSVSSLRVTLGSGNSSVYNEHMFRFTVSGSSFSLSCSGITAWVNGKAPTFISGSTYMVSVVNGLAVYGKF